MIYPLTFITTWNCTNTFLPTMLVLFEMDPIIMVTVYSCVMLPWGHMIWADKNPQTSRNIHIEGKLYTVIGSKNHSWAKWNLKNDKPKKLIHQIISSIAAGACDIQTMHEFPANKYEEVVMMKITTLLSTTANHKSHHTNWYFSKTPNRCNVQFITRPRACKKLKSCGLGAFGSSKSASALGKDQNRWVVMLKRRHHKFYIKNGHFTAWITWILVESGQSYQHLEVVFILCSDKAYGRNVHPAFFPIITMPSQGQFLLLLYKCFVWYSTVSVS